MDKYIIKIILIILMASLAVGCGGGGASGTLTGTGESSAQSTSAGFMKNSVPSSVSGVASAPTLSEAVYPDNWATTGIVIAPSVSRIVNTFADGSVTTEQDGTSAKPFLQSTLAAQSAPISDPSAHVSSTSTTYNLTWGTPDKNGPFFAGLFPSAASQLGVLSLMGRSVTSYTSLAVGPTLLKPSGDVVAAWNSGWTGLGKSILLFDSFSDIATCSDAVSSSNECHGMHTLLIAKLVAPYAELIGLDSSMASIAKNGTSGISLTSPINSNVINVSLGATPCNTGCGGFPTVAAFAALTASVAAWNASMVSLFNTTSNSFNVSNMANSVIVKAAGNAYQDAKYDATTIALVENANIASRLIVVGSLDKNGTILSKANADTLIGSGRLYSNYSGTNLSISDRFVFAYGRDPYASNSVAFNGTASPVGQGTSYAAPVVAGYAAIVMQKFPNLDAIKTSSIILDTARYDTLSCYPSCNPEFWGKGEASLSRALAPVGRLR